MTKYILPILAILCLFSCEKDPGIILNAPKIKLLEHTDLRRTTVILNGELDASALSSIKEIGFLISEDATLGEDATKYTIEMDDSTSLSNTEYNVMVRDLKIESPYFYAMYVTNGITTLKTEAKAVVTLRNSPPSVGPCQAELSKVGYFFAELYDDGGSPVEQYSFCWADHDEPTIYDNHIKKADKIEGEIFSTTFPGMVKGVVYYVRAIADNKEGISYGPVLKYQVAEDAKPAIPSLKMTLLDHSDLRRTTVILNGMIDELEVNDVEEIGFMIGKDASLGEDAIKYAIDLGELTSISNSKYSVLAKDLNIEAPYFYAMYAIKGSTIVKTDVKSVTTPISSVPSVGYCQTDITKVGYFFAELHDDGGSPVEQYSFCWADHEEPTIADNNVQTTDNIVDKIFSTTFPAMVKGVVYYVRAIAESKEGISYGPVLKYQVAEDIPDNHLSVSSPVNLGNFIVSDRNLGENVPTDGVAYNYTNDSEHADHKNSLFKGDYYTWEEARTACPSGWRLPTKTELEVIYKAMQHSDSTSYISDDDGNRCYFPLSGRSSSPSRMDGEYWSSSSREFYGISWCLGVDTISSSVYDLSNTNGLSLRCIKTDPSVEASITLNNASDATLSLPSAIAAKVIHFSSPKSWTVVVSGANTNWCTISNKMGEAGGDGSFTIKATENTSDTDRTATITISSEGATQIIQLTQSKQTTSSSISTSVSLGDFIVADRNLGVSVPTDGVAYNYTNDSEHADHKNSSFKGDYYTWEKAKTACPSGWRLPTMTELEVIDKAMQHSDSTSYISDGNGNRCYFPLSGSNGYPFVDASYWSSTESFSSYAWSLDVRRGKSILNSSSESNGFSVRCIKTDPSAQASITLNNAADATLSLPPEVGNKVIHFSSPKSWTVAVSGANTNWCTISNKMGEAGGDGSFTINATANTSDTDRTVTITISSGGATQIIKLTQSAQAINISISTSISLGDFIVADRNLGVSVPTDVVAYNYTNDEKHVDNKNSSFKGDYYTWEEARTACPSGWRLPTKTELEVIDKAMQYSDGRSYITDGNGNRCYFPLSGFLHGPSVGRGYYRSSTENGSRSTWFLDVSTSTGYVNYSGKSDGLSVRCVKTVP